MPARKHALADGGPLTDHRLRTYGTTLTHASRTRRGRVETDEGEYVFVPAFPVMSKARTTFHASEADGDERRWGRLWCLQHNRGHTWDDHAKTTARNDATYRRCAAILQHCEVPEWAENAATTRVVQNELRGFSRHYAGADGACVGFALLELYDGADEARQSLHAEQAADVVPELSSDDIGRLIDYVFREYAGAT